MANYIHLTGNDNPIPSYTIIYKKPTNNVGGWSYAARPEAEDSKFYELKGEWFYVVKDKAELISLRDQGTWMTSTDPNQLVSITDKDYITKSIPMNNLVTTRVNNMSDMFRGLDYYNLSSFNQYIGNWDTGNVTDMEGIFAFTNFNQPIGNWDVQNVWMAKDMFAYGHSFNQPIGNWDTGNMTDMRFMFARSSFNQPIGNWAVHNVTNMNGMFSITPFNQDIGNWAVQNVRNMEVMFGNNFVFNQDLSSWCVSGVTNHTDFDMGTTAWVLSKKPRFNNPPC